MKNILIEDIIKAKGEFEKDIIKCKLLKLFQSYIRTHSIYNLSSLENTMMITEKYSSLLIGTQYKENTGLRFPFHLAFL